MQSIKKILRRILILLSAFLLSLLVTIFLMAGEDTENRQDMNDPVMAEVMMEFSGVLANRMIGYAQPMQEDFIRDSITPLDSTRELTFVINPYDLEVYSLSYEIRSSDGSKVMENRKIKTLEADDSYLRTTTEITSSLLLNQEYSMQIMLETNQGNAYYYTRVISRSNLNAVGYLNFVNSFVDRCLDNQKFVELVDYIEPDPAATGTNYSSIDITASLTQISWGDMAPRIRQRGIPIIKDINETTASIYIDYQLSTLGESNENEIYNVTEFYRMRYTAEEMMLLDFDRRVGQVFTPTLASFTTEGLLLGIRDRHVDYVTNQAAGITAFVQEGELWTVSPDDARTTQVFSFRRRQGGDVRDSRVEHGIQIIRLEDNGDMDFVVYGYMNRGEREGYCGLCVYHYNNDRNVVEERVFIPSTESFQFLKEDLGKLSYVSEDGALYILFGGSLYQINIDEGSYAVLEEGIVSSQFAVSRGHAHAAWIIQEGKHAGQIRLIDFETLKKRLIRPKEGRQLRLIGFMNEDLIYGILREQDILTDEEGHTREGLRQLRIEDFDGTLLKKYTAEKDLYITSYDLGPMLLSFTMGTKSGGTFKDTKDDNILNNSSQTAGMAKVELALSYRRGTLVRLAFEEPCVAQTPLVIYAKTRSVHDRTIKLDEQTAPDQIFFVYAGGGLDSTWEEPGPAIMRANETFGVVLNRAQQYIWERGNMKTNVMLNLDDIPSCIREGWLDQAALQEAVGEAGTILDLSGCGLEDVLYEVSSARPLIAKTGSRTSTVIVGYDEYNTWLLDPATGEVKANGREESAEMFEKAGNVFFTFVEAVVFTRANN